MRLGIRAKLLIFATLVWAVIFGAYSVYIYKERIAQTRRMALMTASYLTREIAASRQFYSSTIIKRAQDAGLKATSTYHDSEKAIPLPSTFTKEVSETIVAGKGFKLNILSLYPINPSSAPRDDFEREGIERFLKGEDTRHFKFEYYDGKQSVRYMMPDMATSQTCVDCHNTNAASPKTDYRIGDVLGGLEVIIPIESELSAAMADIWRSIGYGFAVIFVMGIAGLVFIRRVVTWPILSLVDTAKQLSAGDLTVESTVVSNDEIGDLGRETNEVVRNLHRVIEEIRRTSDEAVGISAGVREMSRYVLDGSKRQGGALDSTGADVSGIKASIDDISGAVEALAASLEKGASSVLELGAGIDEVVDNVELLFTSVDETALSTRNMSHSINEISENIENLSSSVTQVSSSMVQINAKIKEVEVNAAEASRFAEDVIKDARSGMKAMESTIQSVGRTEEITRETRDIVKSLCERIKEIAKILGVIGEVSEETNLLALNAAIVAAQSGEHGKSFSVVANEIKDLAERTSTSAREVSEIIGAVEIESRRAVSSIERGFESVEEGVKLSGRAGEGLRKIVESAGKSNSSVREIARVSGEQAGESRMVVEAIERVSSMIRRIVNAAQEQARGSELINRASERMAEIAYKVKASAGSQVEASRQITSTMEDVNTMVAHVKNFVKEQGKNTVRAIEAIDAARKISVENIGKAVETDRSIEELEKMNKELIEIVNRFKLGE